MRMIDSSWPSPKRTGAGDRARLACPVQKEIVRIENLVAEKLERISMECVGACFCNEAFVTDMRDVTDALRMTALGIVIVGT
jgi:hypothetical protein